MSRRGINLSELKQLLNYIQKYHKFGKGGKNIKYTEPIFDHRTSDIFSISFRGLENKSFSITNEAKDKNLLDMVYTWLNESFVQTYIKLGREYLLLNGDYSIYVIKHRYTRYIVDYTRVLYAIPEHVLYFEDLGMFVQDLNKKITTELIDRVIKDEKQFSNVTEHARLPENEERRSYQQKYY